MSMKFWHHRNMMVMGRNYSQSPEVFLWIQVRIRNICSFFRFIFVFSRGFWCSWEITKFASHLKILYNILIIQYLGNGKQRMIAEDVIRHGNVMRVPAKVFTFRELAIATENFSSELLVGEGGFGRVYKGHIKNIDQVFATFLYYFWVLSNVSKYNFHVILSRLLLWSSSIEMGFKETEIS